MLSAIDCYEKCEKVYLGLTTSHIVAHSSGIELNVRTMSGPKNDDAAFSQGQAVTVQWQKNAARLHVD